MTQGSYYPHVVWRGPVKIVQDVKLRKGRNRSVPIETCFCDSYPFPHRLGGGDCDGNNYCCHGWYLPDSRCPECEREEYGDLLFDLWHDEHGL